MLQEILVSPTAKLDISKLIKSESSPSPPPRSTTSRPSVSSSFSIPTTKSDPRFTASPTTSTNPRVSGSNIPSQSFNPSGRPSTGGQAPLQIPATSSKRTASTSPLEPRQSAKKSTRQSSKADDEKPTRQWNKAADHELIRRRGNGEKWDDVAAHFPGRSPCSCRLRHQNYCEKRYPWTEEQKKSLAQLYHRDKETMWTAIGKELNIPWKAIEDMHWDIGREEMARLGGGKTLHSNRATGDLPPGGSPMSSVFPSGSQAMTPANFRNTAVSAFSGLPPTPGGTLSQPQPPVTTNGAPLPRMTSWDAPELRPGSARGPGQLLPSMAEFERSVQAFAPPNRGRRPSDNDDVDDDDEDFGDDSDEQWEKVERK